MPDTVLISLIAGLSSVSGILAGALSSYLSNRNTRNREWRQGLLRERILERRSLYTRFVVEADRNFLEVLGGGGKTIDRIMPLLQLHAEISLLGSPDVQDSAKGIVKAAVARIAADEPQEPETLNEAKTLFISTCRKEFALLSGIQD